jgi:excisionase family DNA binding protein
MKLLYTSQDVCEMLGVNIKVVYRLIKEKKLGHVKLHNKGFHFTMAQVRDLIRLLTIPAKASAGKAARKRSPTDRGRPKARKQDVNKATLRKEMREWQ